MRSMLLLIGCAAGCATPAARLGVNGLDVWQTNRVTAAALVERHEGSLRPWAAAACAQRPELFALKDRAVTELTAAELRGAEVSLSAIVFRGGVNAGHCYATIEVVEPEDRAQRSVFREDPTGHPPVPEALFATWNAYLETSERVAAPIAHTPCPVFHCLSRGFDHPALASFLPNLEAAVPGHEGELRLIVLQHADAERRAAALFLLAHGHDGPGLVEVAAGALTDPNSLVRNNAARVLGAIVESHPELSVPLGPLIPLANGPTTTDRNKALSAISNAIRSDADRLVVLDRLGPLLLRFVRQENPLVRDPARRILERACGSDERTWRRCVDERR